MDLQKKKKCVKIEIPSEILVVQDFSFVKPSKKKKRTYFDFETWNWEKTFFEERIVFFLKKLSWKKNQLCLFSCVKIKWEKNKKLFSIETWRTFLIWKMC